MLGSELNRYRDLRVERLQVALDQRGWTRFRLSQELANQAVPGASRQNVDRYFNDEVSRPPVEFFIAAARLLDVELLWLLGISDAMTRVEALQEEEAAKAAIRTSREKLDRELQRGFPAYTKLSEAARGAVQLAWMSRHHQLMQTNDPPTEYEAGAREVGRAIMAPLKALDVDTAALTRWQMAHYTIAVSQAMAFLNPEYSKIHPMMGD